MSPRPNEVFLELKHALIQLPPSQAGLPVPHIPRSLARTRFFYSLPPAPGLNSTGPATGRIACAPHTFDDREFRLYSGPRPPAPGPHYNHTMKLLSALLLLLLLPHCAATATSSARSGSAVVSENPPAVMREFRGVWVATVSNIDWPSKRGLPVEDQQRELMAILDRAKALNLNAIVFQIRPAGDAMYASDLEPWSEYLTGEMGRAPEPLWDPLEFVIRESHRRGLELHAWLNPYRGRHPSGVSPISPTHLHSRRPDLVPQYGKHLWMDPGEPEVRAHTTAVIVDVLRRYDVDGIHFDDYFYPYREKDEAGVEIDFPDTPSWDRYVAAGGTLARNDWRRENVNLLVREVYEAVRREKPLARFGVSPFGVWRPGYPETIAGLDAYESLYADSLLWFRSGWLDYFAPQLYWATARKELSFPVLLNWWSSENVKKRHLWPGLATYRDGGDRFPSGEIAHQIRTTRAVSSSPGVFHFSEKSLRNNINGVTDRVASLYAEPALVPSFPWIDARQPEQPTVIATRMTDGIELEIRAGDDEIPRLWVIQTRTAGRWRTEIVPAATPRHGLSGKIERVVVSAVDQSGNQSTLAVVNLSLR